MAIVTDVALTRQGSAAVFSTQTCFVLGHIISGNWLLDHAVILLWFPLCVNLHFHEQSSKDPLFLNILNIIFIFHDSVSRGKEDLIVVLICIFLMIRDIEHFFFMCVLMTYVSSFGYIYCLFLSCIIILMLCYLCSLYIPVTRFRNVLQTSLHFHPYGAKDLS